MTMPLVMNNNIEDPEYTSGAGQDDLRRQTMCMTAQLKAGLNYDVHNLYGTTEAIHTNM